MKEYEDGCEESKRFGISKQAYTKAEEADNLQSIYDFNDSESEMAFFLTERFEIKLSQAFEIIWRAKENGNSKDGWTHHLGGIDIMENDRFIEEELRDSLDYMARYEPNSAFRRTAELILEDPERVKSVLKKYRTVRDRALMSCILSIIWK